MRHGYFIATTGQLCGDTEFALLSKDLFDSLGLTQACKHKDCPEGVYCEDLHYQFCNHYDGASYCQKEDGSISRVICLRDFFREEFKVMVHLLPLIREVDKVLN